ncbi:unnamed protein product, partial [marine sediment metagenome]
MHGAADGDQAAGLIEQNHYDFLITDLKLPGRSGVEVAREARRRCPRIGIMILTGYGSLDTAVEAVRLGAWDYVTKPCDVRYMRQRIGQFVERAAGPLAADTASARLTSEDLAGFTAGAGTEILSLSPGGGEDYEQRVLALLDAMLADFGFSRRRREQILQVCVETMAGLADDWHVRAGLLKGNVVVCVRGRPPVDRPTAGMPERVSAEFGLDVQVVESDGARTVLLWEGLADEGPRAVPRWNAHVGGRRASARK